MKDSSALSFRADSMVWFLPLLVAGLAVGAAAPDHSPDLLLLGVAVILALLPPMAAITCLGLTNARMLVFLGFGCSIVAFEYLAHVLWGADLPVAFDAAAWAAPRLTEALLFTGAAVLTRSLQQNWSWPLAYTACILLPLLLGPEHQSTALILAAVLFALNLAILSRGYGEAPDLLPVLWANVLQLVSVLMVLASRGNETGLLVSFLVHAAAYAPIVFALLGVARNPSDDVSETALLFDTVPDPVVLVDSQGTVHRLNASARRFGDTGSNCHTLFHGPSDRAECPVCTHLRDGSGPAVFYLTDGMRAPREVELVPLRGTPGLYLHLRRYVTRRRLVAGANLQSNREFAAVFSNTHVALAYVDADLCFVCVNRVFAKAVGRPQDEFPGRSLDGMGFGAFALEQCRKVLDGAGSLSGGGEQGIVPTAEQRLWNWSIEPVLDGNRPTHLVLSLVEVTDQQLAKEAARRFEDGYLAVQEHVSDGLLVTDFQGKIHEANIVTENLTGYERAQLRNMTVFDLHPPEEHDRVRFALVNLDHGFRVRVELELLHATGDRRVVEVAAASFRFGDARRTLGCLRDVTERKRAEEALRQREARSRAILEQGGMGVAIVSPRGEIIESNPAMLRITGYTQPAITGLRWEQLVPTAPAAQSLDPAAVTYTGRHRLQAHDGKEHWVDITLTQVRDGLGALDFIIAMFMDVTAAHEAEEAAQLHERELARANAWKSRFIASASHDIRQPLQAVTILLHLMEGQPLDDGTRTIIDKIGTAMRNLADMVNSILDLSKLDAGLIVAEFSPVQLDRVLQSIEDEFRPISEAKGLALKIERQDDIWVRTDRRLLARILGNLVANAIRYTDRGEVQVLLRPGDGEIAVKVVDTGIGIPDDECKRVFEEFHQAGNAQRGRSEGMGLGLAIVEQLSRLLGVRIAVKSQVGIGTLFTVWIPLAQEEVVPEDVDESEPIPLLRSQLQALVIDDERDIRDALSVALSREGYLVVAASSCKEALATLSTHSSRPDVIVADYRLHDGTGLDAIFALREYLGRRIPAILLTGETHASIRAEARERGCELVLKPATPQHLRRAIASVLDAEAHPPRREAEAVQASNGANAQDDSMSEARSASPEQ
jgi:PAS domain S-box-containing protein